MAPKEVVLFSKDWQVLGTKTSLAPMLSRITGIDEPSLLGASLDDASISKRMSWAANRHTTRPEDTAYCLLGIVSLNMHLLYGEGSHAAFQRLQIEVAKRYPRDHTIYAWGTLAEDRKSVV